MRLPGTRLCVSGPPRFSRRRRGNRWPGPLSPRQPRRRVAPGSRSPSGAAGRQPRQWDTAQPRPSSSERPVSTLLRGLSPDTWRPVPRPDTSGESVSSHRPSCGSEVHSGLVRGLGQLSGAKGPRTSRRLPARLGRRGGTRRRPDAVPERPPWDLVFKRVFRGVPEPQKHERERHGPRRHEGNEVSPHLR